MNANDEFDKLLVDLCHELDDIRCMIDTDPNKAKSMLEELVGIITETLYK